MLHGKGPAQGTRSRCWALVCPPRHPRPSVRSAQRQVNSLPCSSVTVSPGVLHAFPSAGGASAPVTNLPKKISPTIARKTTRQPSPFLASCDISISPSDALTPVATAPRTDGSRLCRVRLTNRQKTFLPSGSTADPLGCVLPPSIIEELREQTRHWYEHRTSLSSVPGQRTVGITSG